MQSREIKIFLVNIKKRTLGTKQQNELLLSAGLSKIQDSGYISLTWLMGRADKKISATYDLLWLTYSCLSSEHVTITQCWTNSGPQSMMVNQYYISIGNNIPTSQRYQNCRTRVVPWPGEKGDTQQTRTGVPELPGPALVCLSDDRHKIGLIFSKHNSVLLHGPES